MSIPSETRSVTATQLKQALQFLQQIQRPAFIWGSMGIGKSDMIASLCEEMGGKLYDVRLSQVEATDLRGMPYYDHDSNTMKWAPPVDLPSAEEAAQYPVVFLFLDELNSASPNIQASAYQLILDRKIGTYTLPPNCYVIAAGNRESDRGVVYRMPKPLANRLIHFELRVDYESWLEWAVNAHVHPDVIGFLNFSKNSLHDFDAKSPEHAFATPRTWEFVSDVCWRNIDESTAMNIFSGTIGEGMALKFDAHRKSLGALPNPSDILAGKVSKLNIRDISAQYSLITSMLYELKDKHAVMKHDMIAEWHVMCDNMLGFVMDNMEIEIQVAGMRMGLQTMAIPFDHKKMSNFARFFAGPGKLILKSTSI